MPNAALMLRATLAVAKGLSAGPAGPKVRSSDGSAQGAASFLVTFGRTGPRPAAPSWTRRTGEGIVISATVRDIMTTSVVAVRRDASFKEMADMLRRRRISAFPVLDDAGRVIGVVSAGDFLVKEAVQADSASVLAALRHIREDDKAAGITAGDLMTKPAITIGPEASAAAAARLMYDRRVKRLPVVNQAGKLLGILSRVDILAVFARPDSDIRDEIMLRVLPGLLAAPENIEVAVRNGIVTLSGELPAGESSALVAAARHVEGVVAVRDRLYGSRRD